MNMRPVPMRSRMLPLIVLLTGLTACGGGNDDPPEPAGNAAEAPVASALPLPGGSDTTAVAEAPDMDQVADPLAAATRSVASTVPEATAEAAPEPEPEPEPAPAAPVAAAPAAGGAYSLQLGSFGYPANADALVGRLGELGYDAAVEHAVVDGRNLHRVVLGGFHDRTEARQVGDAIQRRLDLEYLIRRRP